MTGVQIFSESSGAVLPTAPRLGRRKKRSPVAACKKGDTPRARLDRRRSSAGPRRHGGRRRRGRALAPAQRRREVPVPPLRASIADSKPPAAAVARVKGRVPLFALDPRRHATASGRRRDAERPLTVFDLALSGRGRTRSCVWGDQRCGLKLGASRSNRTHVRHAGSLSCSLRTSGGAPTTQSDFDLHSESDRARLLALIDRQIVSRSHTRSEWSAACSTATAPPV